MPSNINKAELFENLLRSSSDVMWSKEYGTNELLYLSDGVRTIYGRDDQEFRDNSQLWLEVIHEQDRAEAAEWQPLILRNDRLEHTYRIVRPDGSIRWVFDRTFLVRDAAGNPVRYVGLITDVTTRKEFDCSLQQAYADLEQIINDRTIELARTNSLLESEMAERQQNEDRLRIRDSEIAHYQRLLTLGEMASGIAHELNQPLAAINNYAETCLDLVSNARDTRSDTEFVLKQVVELAGRASEIIRRLKALARKQEFRRSTVNVAEVAQEALRFVERETQLAEVRVALSTNGQPTTVFADSIQLQQVIINLVRNAVEAQSELPANERRLGITIHRGEHDRVEVCVSNPGPAVSDEVKSQVFEPFFTTKVTGLGMGLAVCRRIIEAHDGTIEVEWHPAGETHFRCFLPAIRQEAVR